MPFSLNTQNTRGMAATEFILTVPVFLLLILLCFEFTLMQVDRHVFFNALVSSSRLLLSEATSTKGAFISDQVVQPLTLSTELTCSPALHERVHHHLAYRMSSVAPGADEFLNGLSMGNIKINLNIPAEVSSFLGTSVTRMVSGYMPALMLVKVDQCTVNSQGVHLAATYQRMPRMPFAGTVVWALYKLSQLNSASNGALHFELDSNFFGVKVHSPAIADAQKRTVEIVETMNKANFGLSELSRAITNDPLLKEYAGEFTSQVSTQVSNFTQPIIDDSAKELLKGLDDVQKQIQQQSQLVTQMLYFIPQSFRVVPMQRSFDLSWGLKGTQRLDAKNPGEYGKWEAMGAAALIAPYKAASGDTDLSRSLWERWHKKLAAGDVPAPRSNP
jgi:hypothetical protein